MEKFICKVEKFDSGLWSFHLMIPDKIYTKLTADGKKRVLCGINKFEEFHAGFMPDGNGRWFIMLNKEKMKDFNLHLEEEVQVTLRKDESKYGMKLPEEFEELLYQDPQGAHYFEQLSDGKKRSLIYIIDKPKSSENKLKKALIILNFLKINSGVLDYKALNEALKDGNLGLDYFTS